MREQINENPRAQIGLVALLAIAAAFLFLHPLGGGGGEAESTTDVVTAAPEAPELEAGLAVASGSVTPTVPSNRLPDDVSRAIEQRRITALLFIKRTGIEDKRVEHLLGELHTRPDVATFLVPIDEVARYTAVTQPVDLQRAPALIVVRPKKDGGPPSASVNYGFQTIETAVQAIVDAEYHGPELPYHP